MNRRLALALTAVGAALLLWNLGRPALWEDESETALRAETVLATGVPRMAARGVLVTSQPSLARFEGTKTGVWIWNTWLAVYLAAASFRVLGETPFSARLPFALAALWTLWLSWRLFDAAEAEEPLERRRPGAPEAGLALLVLSPAYLLFARQSRYYALTALGCVLALTAWRRLVAGRRGGAAAVALALQVLLHASLAYFAAGCLVLAADALLRGRSFLRERRLWAAAVASALLAAPAIWYFRVWDRPGNHLYSAAEGFEFLKTLLLWISLFSLAPLLPAAAAWKRRAWTPLAAGALLLCLLAGEGFLSRAAAGAALAWIAANGAFAGVEDGAFGLRRLAWLWLAASLAVLSAAAAEPYGRYLMGVLPVLAYLGGRWLSELSGRRAVPAAALAVLLAATNWPAWLAVRAASFLGAPREPVQSVSGMMRARLRDVGPRSDLGRFLGETWRGASGYVEPVAAAIRAGGGGTVFSDDDNLSVMFAADASPVYAWELDSIKPDWLLLSPWLPLDAEASAGAANLLAGGHYESAGVAGPRLLWQNNPDPLFRDYAPRTGPLALYRRKPRNDK